MPTTLSRSLDEEIGRGVMQTVNHTVFSISVPPNLWEDARQEALLGAWKAMLRYNPASGCKPRTYAAFVARGQVIDFLRREDPLTRNQRKRVRDGRDPSVMQLGEKPLHALYAPQAPDPTIRMDVQKLLEGLPVRERYVICELFFRERTLEEVGRELKVGIQRCAQIRNLALQRMWKQATSRVRSKAA